MPPNDLFPPPPLLACSERGKLYLCNDEAVVVTKAHIDRAVGRLNSEGRFGHDNRAGVPGQLHRVSVMRSREVEATPSAEHT